MSSGRKLGDEAASRLASRATPATTAQPINPTKMKTPLNHLHTARFSPAIFCAALVCTLVFSSNVLRADETCSSPYLARIDGQEEFVYVWTLGVEGMGDGSDKLVTVDVKPGSPSYGKVVSSSSVDGRNEAHHGGFTDDRRQLWLAGLESSRVFIFDVHTDPAKPKLTKTIDNFAETTGGSVGPHGAYALPGRVLIPCLSNAKDKGGKTALVEYGNDGNYITTHWLPTKEDARGASGQEFADGRGRVDGLLPKRIRIVAMDLRGVDDPGLAEGVLEDLSRLGHDLQMIRINAAQTYELYDNLIDTLAVDQEVMQLDTRRLALLRQQYGHLKNSADLERDYLREVLEMLQTRLSNELNIFVRKITAYGTIAISWTVVAGVYGMNFADMPELSWNYGYPAAIGLMLGLSVTLWVLFRRHHWL